MTKLHRRIAQLEADVERLMTARFMDLIERDPELKVLLERWNDLADAVEDEVPPDFRPDPTRFAAVRRVNPDVDIAIVLEVLWRREQARRQDPELDAALTAAEQRAWREIRGLRWP